MVVMLYVRYPLSLRNVEDLLFERGIDLCHETVRLWWNRFGPLFAADIRRQRVSRLRGFTQWRCWGGRPPTASQCAKLRSLKISGKETVRGTDYQNWDGYVEAYFSAARGECG
jgi:hypothetical protein